MTPVRDDLRPSLGAIGSRPIATAADLQAALLALRVGVAIVGPDWTVVHADPGWTALSSGPALGRLLWDAIPALGTEPAETHLRATMTDGVTRGFRVVPHSADGTPAWEVRCARMASGALALEARDVVRSAEPGEVAAENRLLRELARQAAAVSDSERLLATLGETVRRETGACGAGVTALDGNLVTILASCGVGLPDAGTNFPLHGSLTERAARLRRVVRQRGYRPPAPQVQQVFDVQDVGELMLAPLIAYEQTVGVLAAVRRQGEPPFTARDEQRLAVIAGAAALVVWNARLLEQVRSAVQAKTEFLTTMSHELRTPLTALTGYGELLTDEIVGELTPPQHDVVERMRTVTHQLTAMIDEILTFSSLEAERERVWPQEVASGEVLRAAAAVIEPLAVQRGLDFVAHVPPDAPVLRTDPDKVRQILVCLGGNAVKFTEHGDVSLAVRAQEGAVRFAVRDTGIGIAVSDQGRLFQPFTQLDGSLTRRYGGTGLGLYIAGRLAELLGGRIEVDSEVGRGSTFELVLPTTRAAAAIAERDAPGR